MAASLTFMAAGLMVGYPLFGVTKVPGKTLNAILMERIAGGWGVGGTIFLLVHSDLRGGSRIRRRESWPTCPWTDGCPDNSVS